MKRLRIEHTTGFRYPSPATASHNEARMLPLTTDSQFVLSSSLDVSPSTSVNSYVDYFGTRVASFDVLTPHDDLMITSRSLIEVRPRPVEYPDVSWDEVAADAARHVDTTECLMQTDRTAPPDDLVEIAKRIASEHEHPSNAALAVCAMVYDEVKYMSGVTGVRTTAAEAWAARKGVCQDISHITLGALRAIGIPARYVSGYLHPKPSAEVGEPVTGESHAWVEWHAGGWWGFDPTNNIEIGDRHVLVGRGRDYNDVPPLRGVFAGPGKSQLHVQVTITREA